MMAYIILYLYFGSSGSDWLKVTPVGIRRMLNWVKFTYGDFPIYITENGVSDRNGSLQDNHRIFYYKHYINNVFKGWSNFRSDELAWLFSIFFCIFFCTLTTENPSLIIFSYAVRWCQRKRIHCLVIDGQFWMGARLFGTLRASLCQLLRS